MRSCLKILLTRPVFLYLVCFGVVWHFLDYQALKENAITQTMSRFTPPINYFQDLEPPKDHYDNFKLKMCIAYHRRVVKYFPFQSAEAYAMLGYCYDRLGNEDRATEFYQKSLAVNPRYFWPSYDLGVLAFRKADYAKAAGYFQQALDKNPAFNLMLMSHSKVYVDVKLSGLPRTYDFLERLKQGRQQAYILMMESLLKAGDNRRLFEAAVLGLKQEADDQDVFYYYAGVAAFDLKMYDKALVFLRQAISADPDNADAFLYLGLCLRAAGRDDLAAAVLAKATQMRQDYRSIIQKHHMLDIRFF